MSTELQVELDLLTAEGLLAYATQFAVLSRAGEDGPWENGEPVEFPARPFGAAGLYAETVRVRRAGTVLAELLIAAGRQGDARVTTVLFGPGALAVPE